MSLEELLLKELSVALLEMGHLRLLNKSQSGYLNWLIKYKAINSLLLELLQVI